MSLLLSVGKPVGIIAAILGLIQGLIWFILTLLAVLSYNCAIDSTSLVENASSSDAFLITLLNMYFTGPDCTPVGSPSIPNILLADEMQIWMILSMVFNFVWMVSSIYYLVDLCQNEKPATSTAVWIGTTSVVVIMDLATTIRFGINYGDVKGVVDANDAPTAADANALTASAFLMAMAARGFVLWLINDALVIFLTIFLINGHKASKASASNLSRQASFVNPTMNHMWPDEDDRTYQQPKDSRESWDPMTPVATSPRPLYPYSTSPSEHQAYSNQARHQQQPVLILQDPPKTHSAPYNQYGATPRHIPDPDYSPIMNHKSMIPPVVLRKPPPRIAHVGRTVF